ncbi:MAG: hypothetical protein Aurels2KO_51060 [Aureliella sp.]
MQAKQNAAATLFEGQPEQQTLVSKRLRERKTATPLSTPPLPPSATDTLEQLSQQVALIERGGRKATATDVWSSGCADMDAILPLGGYQPGSLVEYLRRTPACGASHLAFTAAAAAMKASGGFLVVVDRAKHFYPPGLVGHGIDLSKVIFVRPECVADTIWAVDQSLRTNAVAAVVAEVNSLDDRAARRLQLAAQRGGGLGLLLRGAATRGTPSWAEVQWVVKPARGRSQQRGSAPVKSRETIRCLDVQLARVRGGHPGKVLRLAIDGRTGKIESLVADERSRHESTPDAARRSDAMHLAAKLAHPTDPGRSATAG